MKREPERHHLLAWRDVLLGIGAELAYPTVLGLAALFLAWLVVRVR
ncbi:MAG: hypothetical protein ACM3ZA_02135 [Bacillota bacterium]